MAGKLNVRCPICFKETDKLISTGTIKCCETCAQRYKIEVIGIDWSETSRTGYLCPHGWPNSDDCPDCRH